MPDRIKTFPIIHGNKLHELLEEDPESLYVLDLRSPKKYHKGHIPGAFSLPFSQLEKKAGEIPKEKIIVLYCQIGIKSPIGVKKLRTMGFPHVFTLGRISRWEYELVSSG